jgi:carbamoyl-phosphate synthase large subunit
MEKKTVLVTGIGGNVGQGIIRNIGKTCYPVKIIGTNIATPSAGTHLCDVFYQTPYSYEENYIEKIIEICQKEKVDLILPSTDYEVYYLALNQKYLPTVVASPANTAEIFLDKYKTWLHFVRHKLPFAETVLPSEYKSNFPEIIAKPREGRGSRGLFFNPKETAQFDDAKYLIQRLYKGDEITIAFYVTKEYNLHGFITLSRKLSDGATSQCKVEKKYDDIIKPFLEQLINSIQISGSCNVQAIITPDLMIRPFEVNCRISGTNSIRSNFGFPDVKYALDEYLYNKPLKKPEIKEGAAIRILMDVIYPGVKDFDEIFDKTSDHYLF